MTVGNIKIGDKVKVLYANDHNAEKYNIGDVFEVRHISETGSDDSFYVSEDVKYKFHPSDVKVISKMATGGGVDIKGKSNKEISDMYWQKAQDIDEELNSDKGGETTGPNYERILKLQKLRDKYYSLSIKYDKMEKGGAVKRKNYTYIPQEDIDYIVTESGKKIDGSKILDGAYVKGKFKNPKIVRGYFEEEEYEMGGGISFEDGYDVSGVSRADLEDLLFHLDYNDISYSYDGPAEILDFDITELDRDWQEKLKNIGIKMYAKGGGISSKTNYVPNRAIQELSYVLKGEIRKIKGSDIVDGVYVKKNAANTKKSTRETKGLYEKLVDISKKDFRGNIGFTPTTIKDFLNAGLSEEDIMIVFTGIDGTDFIKADTEFGKKTPGLLSFTKEGQQDNIKFILDNIKKNTFEIGLKYPDFNWKGIIKKYEIKSEPKIVTKKTSMGEYKYQVFIGKGIVIGQRIARKEGKDWVSDGNEIISLSKVNEFQKERAYKPGFNGGYWGIVTRTQEAMLDIVKALLSQSGGYVKDLDLFTNRLGGVGSEEVENLQFAKGGGIDERVIFSFSFNTDNISLDEVKNIVNSYSKDWKTSGDISEVNMYVTLRKSQALELKKELKSYGYFYDFEMETSSYQFAKGGNIEFSFDVTDSEKLRKYITSRFRFKKDLDYYDIDKCVKHYNLKSIVDKDSDNSSNPYTYKVYMNEEKTICVYFYSQRYYSTYDRCEIRFKNKSDFDNFNTDKFATGGQIDNVFEWVGLDYSKEQIKDVFEAIEEAGYDFPRDLKTNASPFNHFQPAHDKVDEIMDSLRISALEGDNLNTEDIKNITWGIVMSAHSQYGMGGDVKAFFGATKETLKKGYNKTKDYTKKQIHDGKKKVALDVLDNTKDKVKSHKDKMALKAAEEIISKKYGDGGEIDTDLSYYRVFKNSSGKDIPVKIVPNPIMNKYDYYVNGQLRGTFKRYEDAENEVSRENFDLYADGGNIDSGLMVIGTTQTDNNKIGKIVDENDFYAEWNTREGFWFFPEELDNYDDLEHHLQELFDEEGISARFEGIFAKGGEIDVNSFSVKNKYYVVAKPLNENVDEEQFYWVDFDTVNKIRQKNNKDYYYDVYESNNGKTKIQINFPFTTSYNKGGSMYAEGGNTNPFSLIREGNNVAYLGEGYKIIKIDNENNVAYIKPLKDALDRQITDFNINSNGVSKVDLSSLKKYAFDIKNATSMAKGGGVSDRMTYEEMKQYEKGRYIHFNPMNSRWEVWNNGNLEEFWNQEQAEKFAGFEFDDDKDSRYSRKKYEALFGYAKGGNIDENVLNQIVRWMTTSHLFDENPDNGRPISDSKFKKISKEIYAEWEASKMNYTNIEEYFNQLEENGDYQMFLFEQGGNIPQELHSSKYALVRIGGSIGSKDSLPVYVNKKMGNIIQFGNDKDELKQKASRMRKNLSEGEKKYYGMNYTVIEITPTRIKEIKILREKQN